MTLAPDHILRITATTGYANVSMRNVYWYRYVESTAGNPDLQALVEGWAELFNTEVIQRLSERLDFTRVYGEDLTDGLDIAEVAVNYSGAVTGDALPPFNAIGVKLLRQTKLTRNGSKRLAGIPEQWSVQGLLTIPQATIDAIEAFHSGFLTVSDPVNPTNTYTLENVIVGRVPDPMGGGYVPDLTKINDVIGAQVNTTATSQVSRKT